MWHSSATLSEVFPCFFLSCKASARIKPAKMGHDLHSSKIFALFYVFFLCHSVYCVCKCALYYCHRVATQLQLNISKYEMFVISQERISVAVTLLTCEWVAMSADPPARFSSVSM